MELALITIIILGFCILGISINVVTVKSMKIYQKQFIFFGLDLYALTQYSNLIYMNII